MLSIHDTFKQFCKERHAEDKGKNFNLLQEVYANTELFDISLYDYPYLFKITLLNVKMSALISLSESTNQTF